MRSETGVPRRRMAPAAVEGDNRRLLPQVRTSMVGLGGLEPPASSSGEDLCPRWQTAWYLPRSTRTSPPSAEQATAQGPCCAAHLHPSGVAAGHDPLTIDAPALREALPDLMYPHVRAGQRGCD